jgi:hypothetical protein
MDTTKMSTAEYKTGECVMCKRVKRILARGLCQMCYRREVEAMEPKRRELRLQYQREYCRGGPQNIKALDPREVIETICWPLPYKLQQIPERVQARCKSIFTIDDWLAFMCMARKRNKRQFQEGERTTHRHGRSKACPA